MLQTRLLGPTLASLLVAITFAPSTAEACGGFFCDSINLIPVDQTAERILFEVNGDGTITAVVEISYSGDPEDFSWVVPVPDTPALEVVEPSTLQLLGAASQPAIISPWLAGDDDDDSAISDDDDDEDPEVELEDLPVVGPFDPVVVSSDDPDALVDWLNDNEYLITTEMEPLVAQYVAEGMKFLAMKLTPESGINDIAPIHMTYPGTEPMVPIVLSAVAAEPEMGIIVMILGDSTYEPSSWVAADVDPSMLRADRRNGTNNYYAYISWQADELGGRAFFTEYSDTTVAVASDLDGVTLNTTDEEDARAWLTDALARHDHFTRLYTRISPAEMATDPTFSATGAPEVVSNVISLTDQPPIPWDAPFVECADNYCGAGSCATVVGSDAEGCVCDEGFVARPVVQPQVANLTSATRDAIACQDASVDMMASIADTIGADPCASYTCGGNGACSPIGGVPTCACDDGFTAVNDGGVVTCLEADQTFGPEQLLWPDWPPEEQGDDDDATSDDDDATSDDDDVTSDDDDATSDDDDTEDDDTVDEDPDDCEGANCAASPPGAAPPVAGLLVVALGVRRRRR